MVLTFSPAAAQQPVFVVDGVGVDVTAEDANAARAVALQAGMRAAYHRLLRRLTPRSSYDLHPEPVPARLASLVYGIEVGNERTSATRYLASLTISFHKAEIRALLRSNGIPFAETPSKPLLVLPVYSAAGAQLLWDEPNAWRAAWGTVRGTDSLLPLVIPNGDLTDVALIGAAQAAAGERARISAIAGRYGVEDAVVAHASLTTAIGSRNPSIDVAMRRFGPAGESTVVQGFRGRPEETLAGLLLRAVEEIAMGMEEQWKRDTLLESGTQGRLPVTVPITALAEWVAIAERLEQAPEVTAVRLGDISKASAHIELGFYGAPERLALALAQRDLHLQEEEGFWILRLYGGGAAGAD